MIISIFPLQTAFTPDQEGRNNCFGLKYWGAVSSLEFNIYDRWGVLTFTTHTTSDHWDGKADTIFLVSITPVGQVRKPS
jgi:gliding motility-associated-like protein